MHLQNQPGSKNTACIVDNSQMLSADCNEEPGAFMGDVPAKWSATQLPMQGVLQPELLAKA